MPASNFSQWFAVRTGEIIVVLRLNSLATAVVGRFVMSLIDNLLAHKHVPLQIILYLLPGNKYRHQRPGVRN